MTRKESTFSPLPGTPPLGEGGLNNPSLKPGNAGFAYPSRQRGEARRGEVWFFRLLTACLAALLLLPLYPRTASATKGGDEMWSSPAGRDQRPGKQTPVASATDSAGNVYISGYELPPGSIYEQMYTVKINSNGALVWRGVYQASGKAALAAALAVDTGTGDVFVTGNIAGDVVILKYAADLVPDPGTKLVTQNWAKTFDNGGAHTATVTSIALDAASVYLAGTASYGGNNCFMVLAYAKSDGTQAAWQIPNAGTSIAGTANSVAAGPGGVAVTGRSADDYFKTIKYDLSGGHVWNKQYDNASHTADAGQFVRFDSNGDVVATGKAYAGPPKNHNNIYTAKYAGATGEPIWSHTTNLGEATEPDGLLIDSDSDPANRDDIYVTGHTAINSFNHIYTIRYESAASTPQTVWSGAGTVSGGVLFNSGGGTNIDYPKALAVDPSADSLFVAGYSSVDSNTDFRVIKYRKSTGAQLWTKTFHGAADNNDQAMGIGLDGVGNAYVVGWADETTPLHTYAATVDNASKTVLEDINTGNWAGYMVKMTNGANSGITRKIQSNTGTTLTLAMQLPNAITTGDSHYIYDNGDQDYYVVKYDRGALNAVTTLSAAAASDSSITINWQDNNPVSGTDPTNFRIDRCTDSTDHLTNCASFSLLADNVTATTYTDESLQPDTYYYYRVTAHNTAVGDTYPSPVVYAATQFVEPATPSKTYTYAGVAPSVSSPNALSIATSPVDGAPVVTGNSFFNPEVFDYYTVKLDRDLVKLWSQRYGEPQRMYDDVDTCVAVDGAGDVIVSGFSYLNNAGNDMDAIYTRKIDHAGATAAAPVADAVSENWVDQWTHQYNGVGGGNALAIAIAAATDASNNVAVVGMGLHSPTDFNKHDIYIMRFPPGGPAVAGYWAAAPIQEWDDNRPTAVAIDPWGDVVITGFVGNKTVAEDPNSIHYHLYTAKFSGSADTAAACPTGKMPGCLLWQQTYDGGIGNDEANGVAIDPAGNIYVTGYATTAPGKTSIITIKYDRNGAMQWGGVPKIAANPAGGDDEGVAVKVDPLDGNIVVAGDWLTDSGNHDFRVMRYRATDGAELWHKTLLRLGSDESLVDMAMDRSGSVFLTGSSTSPGGEVSILTVEVDSSGAIVGNAVGYTSTASPAEAKPFGIAVNSLGEAFVAAYTKNLDTTVSNLVLKIGGDTLQVPYPVSATAKYTTITLNWSDNSRNETGYQVVKNSGACPAEPVDWSGKTPVELGAGSVTHTDSGLTAGTTYCYGVRARNGSTYSRWVNVTVATATPPGPIFTPSMYLDIPNIAADAVPASSPAIIFGARASSTTSVRITWGVPAYLQAASGYEIQRCMDGGENTPCTDFAPLVPQPVQTPGSQVVLLQTHNYVAAEDTTVCPGATYRYRIKASGTDWIATSVPMGVILPVADNLVVDGGFESVDPESPWYSPVGSTLAPADFPAPAAFSGSKGFRIINDNSAVTGNADWNGFTTTVPKIAAVGAKTASLGDGSLLSQLGWQSKRALTDLSANAVNMAKITRAADSPGGSEPQYGFRDLRIWDTVNNVELPALFVSGMSGVTNGSVLTVWFKAGANTSGIYAYYGNDSAEKSANVAVPPSYTGRKETVLPVKWGKYTLSANVNSNLAKGYLVVSLSQDTYSTSNWKGANSSNTNMIVVDSNAAGLNRSLNDNAWHALSQDILYSGNSSLPASNSYQYARVYLVSSPYDIVTIDSVSYSLPAHYPRGTVLTDNVQLIPRYDVQTTATSEMQVTISWSDSSFDATGYKIERCSGTCTSGDSWSQIGTVGANAILRSNPGSVTSQAFLAFSDWGLTPGATYSYRVRPYKTFSQTCGGSAGWDGGYSNISVVTTPKAAPVLTATAANTTQVNLGWTDTTANESQFQIVRGSGSDCAALGNLTTVGTNTLTFSDTTACSNTTYSYCVRPRDFGLRLPSDLRMWLPLQITNPIANFQTRLTLTVAQIPGVRSDFADLRLYNATAQAEMPYWVETMVPGSSVTVWFKIPANVTDKLYLYYGSPNATAPIYTISTIFEFFEGFDGPNLGPNWSQTVTGAATLTFSGGLATADSTQNSNHQSRVELTKVGGLTPPYRLEARINVSSSYLGQGLIRIRGLGGVGDTGIFDIGSSKLQAFFNGTGTNAEIPADQFIRWRADHLGGTLNTWSVFREDNTQLYSTTYTGNPSGIYLAAGDGGGGNGKVTFDWIFARKYSAVEPTVVVGTPSSANDNDIAGLTYGNIWDGLFSKPTAGAPSSAPTVVSTPARPGAPTLAAGGVTRASEERIAVTWTFTNADQTGFKIDRCADAACSTVLATQDVPTAATRTYTDTGLEIDTTYWYRVRAYKTEDPSCNGGKGFWETANSAIQSATTSLSAPAGVGVTHAFTTNCEDIRFMDGATSLNYYIAGKDAANAQCNALNTKFFVKVPEIPGGGKSIYMYYGNARATNLSSGQNVFEFFEDFDYANIDAVYSLNKWDSAKSDLTGFSLANSKLTGTNSTGKLVSKTLFGNGYQVQARVKATSVPGQWSFSGFVPLGLMNSAGDNAGILLHPTSMHYYSNSNFVKMTDSLTPPAGSALTDALQYVLTLKSTNTFSVSIYDWEGNNNFSYWAPADASQTVNSRPIVIGRRQDADYYGGQAYGADWEWIRVRKYADPAPTASVGSVDVSGSPYTLAGEPATWGTWRFRKPVTLTYASGSPTRNEYQVNFATDTTSLATDRNTVAWTAKTSGETNVILERCDGSDCTTSSFPRVSRTFTLSPGTVSYTDRETYVSSASAANFCYRVKAVKSGGWVTAATPGETPYSPTVCQLTDNPGAPTGFSAAPGATQVVFTWTDNAVGETGFRLERCTEPCDLDGGANTVISLPPQDNKVSTTGTYTDTTLTTSDSYRYRITAYKDNPDGTSWTRGPTLLTGLTTSLNVKPPAPQNVIATRVTEQNIQVTWQDPASDESGFQVWRCAGFACTAFEKLPVSVSPLTGSGGTVTWNDTFLLVPGTTYGYQIRAVGATGVASDPSPANGGKEYATASYTTPSGFSVNAWGSNNTQVYLSWGDTTSAESGFAVTRCQGYGSCDSGSAIIGVAAAGATSLSDAQACADTAYTYTVSALEPLATPLSNNGAQPAWKYKSQLSIANFQSNFITPVTIAKDADMKADFNDLRFFDRTAQVELPYSIQSSSATSATVWFKTGANDTIDLYYGNSSATSVQGALTGTGPVAPIVPVVTVGPKTSEWSPVRVPLTFSAFQANALSKITLTRDPAKSVVYNTRADFRDLRFYDRNANRELPYWIRKIAFDGSNKAVSAEVWFMTGASVAVELYYGNASANNATWGQVGWWPFSEAPGTTSGSTADWGAWGMNGILSSNFAAGYGIVADGKYGNGLKLDGTSNYATVTDYAGSPLDITGSVTVELWYNYQGATTPWSRLVTKGSHPDEPYAIVTGATGSELIFYVNPGSNQYQASGTSPALSAGWHHVVGRYDHASKKVSLFVDGTEYASTLGAAVALAANDGALAIGAQANGSYPVLGSVDDVRIYNRSLSDAEVAARANEGATLQTAAVAVTPVAYWRFEEAAGTYSGSTAETSGSYPALNGTFTGFAWNGGTGITASGKVGNGLNLNGTSNYVSVADVGYPNSPLDITGSITVEAWYQYQPSQAWSRIVGKPTIGAVQPWDLYGIGLNDEGSAQRPYFIISNSNTWNPPASQTISATGPALTPGTWYHIAGRYNQTTGQISIFVNGVPYSNVAAPITIAVNNEPLGIGRLGNYGSYAKGVIDEVRIYSSALDDPEIIAHYNAGNVPAAVTSTGGARLTVVTPKPGNMVADPDFDMGSWNVWPDWTGITLDQTVAYSGTRSTKISQNMAAGATRLVYKTINNLKPGGTYVMSGFANLQLSNAGFSHAFCYLTSWGVNWASSSMVMDGTDTTKNNKGWIPFSVQFTIPANNAGGPVTSGNLECGIRTDAGGGGNNTAWFDMIQLAPIAPTVTVTRASENSIAVTWNDIYGTDKSGYNIYRCMDSAGNTPCTDFAKIKQAAAIDVPYIDAGLQVSRTYRYKISAYKAASCAWESTASDPVSASTAQVAPVIQSVTPLTSTSMQIAWTDAASSESGYKIYRCTGSNCEPCLDGADCSTTTETYYAPSVFLNRSLDTWLKAFYPLTNTLSDKGSRQTTGTTTLTKQITGIVDMSGLSVGMSVGGTNIPAGTIITGISSDPAAWVKKDNQVPAAFDSSHDNYYGPTSSTNGRIAEAASNGMGDYGSLQSMGILVEDSPKYRMWYSGNDNGTSGSWRIYYATSPDGLVWTKADNSKPAVADAGTTPTTGKGRIGLGSGTAGIGDSVHTYASQSVIRDGSTYKMWYSGHDGQYWRIYYATSSDGLNWTKYDNTVPANSNTTGTNGRIPLGTKGDTPPRGDCIGVFAPAVIKDDGEPDPNARYKMWYSGADEQAPAVWRIFYATSPDGLTWAKRDNSVPAPSDTTGTNGRIPLGNAGKGDSIHTRFATVLKDGATYRMWYSGVDDNADTAIRKWRIFYASSPDGVTWTKYNNAVPADSNNSAANSVPAGTSGGDVLGTFGASVVKEGPNFRMWYSGMDSTNKRRLFLADNMTTVTLSENPIAAASGFFTFGQGNVRTGRTDPASAPFQIIGLSSTAGLSVGMTVIGTGIPADTTIASIKDASTVVLSNDPTTAASGSYVFALNLIPDCSYSWCSTYDAGGGLNLDYYPYSTPASSILDNDNHTIEFDLKFRTRTGYNGTYYNFMTYSPTGGPNLVISSLSSSSPAITWTYSGTGVTGLSTDGYGMPFVIGRWYRFRGVKNGTGLVIYVDDRQAASVTVPRITDGHAAGSRSAPLQLGVISQPAAVTVRNVGISSGYAGSVDSSLITYNDLQVCPGSYYNYRVMPVSYGIDWNGATSNRAGSMVMPFNPPMKLTAVAQSESQVLVSWSPNAQNDQTKFQLQKCLGGSCDAPVDVGNALSYSMTGLTGDATQYCFQVAGWKSAPWCPGGGVSSAFIPSPDASFAGAGGGTWSKQAQVLITNPQPDFQTKLTVAYLPGMKNDFSDIRLYNAATQQEIPYWVENKTDEVSTLLWFRTPTNTADPVFLYYGNSSAGTPAYSPSAVFEFFDGFDGGALDAATWSVSAGATASVSGGRLSVANGSVYTSYPVSGLASPIGMTFEIKNSWTVAAANASGLTVCSSQATYSGNGTNQVAHADLRLSGANGLQGVAGDGSTTGWNVTSAYLIPNSGIPANSDVNIAGADRIIGIDFPSATGLNFFSKDPATYAVHYQPATTTFPSVWNPTGSKTPFIYIGHIWGSNAGNPAVYPMNVDWARVRKYSVTPPVATLGTVGPRDGSENLCTKTQLNRPSNPQLVNGDLWPNRAQVTIANCQPGVQTKLLVGYQAGMNADFSDLRLYDTTTGLEVPYWLESKTDGATATIWIKPSSADNTTCDSLYLYYGNKSALPASYSGSMVFDFFDGFDGTSLDTSKWGASDPAGYALNGGMVRVNSGALYSKVPVVSSSAGYVYEMKGQWLETAKSVSGFSLNSLQQRTPTNASDPREALVDIRINAGSPSQLQVIAADGTTLSYNLNPTAPDNIFAAGSALATDRILGIEFPGSNPISLYSKGLDYSEPAGFRAYATGTWNLPPYIYLGFFYGSGSTTTDINDMIIDWVRARRYTATPATASVGTGASRNGSDTIAGFTNPAPSGATMSPFPYKVPLVWKDNSLKENSYLIERKVWNGQWVRRAVVNNATSYIDTIGIEPQKAYTYRIRALNTADSLQSPYANEFTVVTPSFTGGDDTATCVCTGTGPEMICK